MKWINAEQQVTVTIYDEEHEEHLDKTMTVEEMLDTYTNEGCPTMYINPDRKRGEWINLMGHQVCTICGYKNDIVPTNFCPNCGADMRQKTANPMGFIKVPKMPTATQPINGEPTISPLGADMRGEEA